VIGAVVIVQPFVQLGINPWVAHFFVFLLSVWGELSPPTSLTAAISARIAEASFMRTMWEALKICLPITLMTFAIFTRSNIVVATGWPQIADTILVGISTCGVAFALFGRYFACPPTDMALRAVLAAIAFVTMFHPNDTLVWGPAAVTLGLLLFGLWRHRIVGAPQGTFTPEEDTTGARGDLSRLMAEAKREV
jgi:TRAP-type uncharacterized transport system fused permease subunit